MFSIAVLLVASVAFTIVGASVPAVVTATGVLVILALSA
jgi:hypothetical protein